MSAARIVVVGGGLSGLSAAVACADSGAKVTLLEARPRLGGATWSFNRGGLAFDNGQHVHLRCCTEYRAFLERLGTADKAPLRGRLAIPVLAPTPAAAPSVAWIRRDPLPAPLHLGRSLLGYSHLRFTDRLRLGFAAWRLRFANLEDPSLDEMSFAEMLGQSHQSPAAIESLWDLIALPTTNLHAADVSLALAAKVFKTGLLTTAAAADIAWSNVPLAELHVGPAARLLKQLGARVEPRARVSALDVEETDGARRVSGVTVDGSHVEADAVVLAVPHDVAGSLLTPVGGAPERNWSELARLGTSPIVNVHFVFDRKVMPYAVAAGVGTPVQFVFDRSEAAGSRREPESQVLAVSLSAADHEIGERPGGLIERYLEALRQLFPAAREARVLDAVVTREHDATFRGAPGSRRLRPAPGLVPGLANLAVAGAWTQTGWPATMESAVRSGAAAAEAAMAACRHRVPGQPHDTGQSPVTRTVRSVPDQMEVIV